MEIKLDHGTLEVRSPGSPRLRHWAQGLLATSLLGMAVTAPMSAYLALLWLGPALALVSWLTRLLRDDEVLLLGLFVQTGREGGTLSIRSTEVQRVSIDEAPRRASPRWLAARLGLARGRLRIQTTAGEFRFGAALSNGELSALAARLSQLGFQPIFSTLARSRNRMS